MKVQIESLISSDQAQETKLDTLATRGTWCVSRWGPVTTLGTIHYDRLTFSDTNMNINLTPLGLQSGNSHKSATILSGY